jgi:hypothetical protein
VEKTCCYCRKPKDEDSFAISPKTRKITAICQDCWDEHYAHRAKSMDYHRDKQKREYRATRNKQITRNRDYLHSVLKEALCIDCGYGNWIALELDHRDPSKKYDAVTRMVNDGTTLERIKEEIEKCDIVCANCHAIRTANRSKSWRITPHRSHI